MTFKTYLVTLIPISTSKVAYQTSSKKATLSAPPIPISNTCTYTISNPISSNNSHPTIPPYPLNIRQLYLSIRSYSVLTLNLFAYRRKKKYIKKEYERQSTRVPSAPPAMCYTTHTCVSFGPVFRASRPPTSLALISSGNSSRRSGHRFTMYNIYLYTATPLFLDSSVCVCKREGICIFSDFRWRVMIAYGCKFAFFFVGTEVRRKVRLGDRNVYF